MGESSNGGANSNSLKTTPSCVCEDTSHNGENIGKKDERTEEELASTTKWWLGYILLTCNKQKTEQNLDPMRRRTDLHRQDQEQQHQHHCHLQEEDFW